MTILTRNTALASHDASPATTNFFTGSVNTGKNSFDPYVSGYAFIVWLKVPSWLPNPDVFKQFSQKNFKSFGGLQNIELETEGVRQGFTANETHYTKGVGNKPSEFTLKYQEHSGSPLTKEYNGWVSGIRDPKTGIAVYPKQFGVEYHSDNHTGTLLYVVTRPDADNFGGKNIEFASLWTHVQPKRINLEHFNFESGSHDFSELEQPFSAYMNIGSEVEKFATDYVASRVYPFYSENSFENMSVFTGS